VRGHIIQIHEFKTIFYVPRANDKIIQFILQGLSDLISLSPPSKQTKSPYAAGPNRRGRALAVAHSNRDLFVIPRRWQGSIRTRAHRDDVSAKSN
jgi:hypothetical protein